MKAKAQSVKSLMLIVGIMLALLLLLSQHTLAQESTEVGCRNKQTIKQ